MSENLINTEEDTGKLILSPYNYIKQARSNDIFMRKIPEALNYWMGISEENLNKVLDIVSTFGHAYILLDDVQDDALYRRKLRAAHCVYGVPLTLNASVYAFALGLNKALQLHPEGAQVYSQQFMDNMFGQGTEIYWRANNICPTESEYKKVIEKKCGSMFLLVTQLMQLCSKRQINLDNFAMMLGLYLQLRDDFCNLFKPIALEERSRSHELQDLNDFCEDITEGKFTLPIIHALPSSEAESILHILKQRTRDVKTKQDCLAMIKRAGSFEYTRQILCDLDRNMRHEMTRLGGNPALEELLDDLLNWKDEI